MLGLRPALGRWFTAADAQPGAEGGVGIAVGLALSAVATRLLRHFLYGVSPLDAAAFTSACLLWLAIALLASYVPARRATQVDPLAALRHE